MNAHAGHPQASEKTGSPPEAPLRDPRNRFTFLATRFRTSRRTAALALIATFVAGLGIGYGLGLSPSPDMPDAAPAALASTEPLAETPRWLDDVAASHRLFAAQKIEDDDLSAVAARSAVSWLSASVGVNFILPDLSGEGLSFKGARLVLADGRPTAQLFYRNEDGETFALGILKADAATAARQDELIRNDVALVYWAKSGSAYVFSGPSSEAQLTALAKKVSGLI